MDGFFFDPQPFRSFYPFRSLHRLPDPFFKPFRSFHHKPFVQKERLRNGKERDETARNGTKQQGTARSGKERLRNGWPAVHRPFLCHSFAVHLFKTNGFLSVMERLCNRSFTVTCRSIAETCLGRSRNRSFSRCVASWRKPEPFLYRPVPFRYSSFQPLIKNRPMLRCYKTFLRGKFTSRNFFSPNFRGARK